MDDLSQISARFRKLGVKKYCAAEVGVAESDTVTVRIRKIGVTKVGTEELAPFERRALEIGAAEIRPGES